MIRLQDKDFAKMRSKLNFVSYTETLQGNIRVNLVLKGKGKGSKVLFYHWLSDLEKEAFKKSTYYDYYSSPQNNKKIDLENCDVTSLEDDFVWKDAKGILYRLEDINDTYLYNILRFMSNGGGYAFFLDKSKIRKLFNEAERRGIEHNFKCKKVEKIISAKRGEAEYLTQIHWEWE